MKIMNKKDEEEEEEEEESKIETYADSGEIKLPNASSSKGEDSGGSS